jgi:hypothetical protein
MQAGHRNTYEAISAFSTTDFRADLATIDIPPWSFTATTTRSSRFPPPANAPLASSDARSSPCTPAPRMASPTPGDQPARRPMVRHRGRDLRLAWPNVERSRRPSRLSPAATKYRGNERGLFSNHRVEAAGKRRRDPRSASQPITRRGIYPRKSGRSRIRSQLPSDCWRALGSPRHGRRCVPSAHVAQRQRLASATTDGGAQETDQVILASTAVLPKITPATMAAAPTMPARSPSALGVIVSRAVASGWLRASSLSRTPSMNRS